MTKPIRQETWKSIGEVLRRIAGKLAAQHKFNGGHLNVPPSSTATNVVGHPSRDTEDSSDNVVGPFIGPDQADICSGDPSIRMLFPAGVSASSLPGAISAVVCSGAKEQVPGIDAPWHIALMENALTLRNVAISNNPRGAMRQPPSVFATELTVSKAIRQPAKPQKATAVGLGHAVLFESAREFDE